MMDRVVDEMMSRENLFARVQRVLLVMVGATVVAGLTPAPCSAESAAAGADAQTITNDGKAQEDPTILKRRVWSDTEWNKYKDGSDEIEETLGAVWAWRVSDHQDWALRLKVPYKFRFAGDAVGDSDKQGLGDIKLGAGTAFRLSESWRTGAGVEVRFPTAAEGLGNDVWRLQLLGALAWDATRQLTLSPSFEYNKSVAELDGAAPQHFLELFFPATYALPENWSMTARYEAKVDFENDREWTHSAKFTIAKQLERLPMGLALSIKKPLDGGNKDFQVNFVTVYYFQ